MTIDNLLTLSGYLVLFSGGVLCTFIFWAGTFKESIKETREHQKNEFMFTIEKYNYKFLEK